MRGRAAGAAHRGDLYMYPEERDNWLRSMAAAGEIRNAELVWKRARTAARSSCWKTPARGARRPRACHLLRGHAHRHQPRRMGCRASCHTKRATTRCPGLSIGASSSCACNGPLTQYRQGSTHAVCYLDLDQFKIINDTCSTSPATSCSDSSRRCCRAGSEQRHAGPPGRGRVRPAVARLRHRRCGDGCQRAAQGGRASCVRVGEQYSSRWARASAWCRSPRRSVASPSSSRRMRPVTRPRRPGAIAFHVYQEDDTLVAQRQRRNAMGRTREAERSAIIASSFEAQPIAVPLAAATGMQAQLRACWSRMQRRVGPRRAAGCVLARGGTIQSLSQRLDRWVITTALQWTGRRTARRAERGIEGVHQPFRRLGGRSASCRTFIRLSDPDLR